MTIPIKRPRAINLNKDNCKNLLLNEKPLIKFKDITGCSEAKEFLKDFSYILKQEKSHYDQFGCLKPKCIMLYGPNGCGKTLLTKALLYNTSALFMNIKITDIVSKWFSESEKNLRHIFNTADKLTKEENKPLILYFDQFEAIFCNNNEFQRDGLSLRLTYVLKELLYSMEDYKNLHIISCVNDKTKIHPILNNIFTHTIFVPKPDMNEIKEYLNKVINSTLNSSEYKNWIEIDINELSNKLLGKSYLDIYHIFQNALIKKVRNWQKLNFNPNIHKLKTIDFNI